MLRSFAAVLLAIVSGTALAQGTIRIGVLGPMNFVQGEHHRNGAQMAADEINKAGGINVGGKRMQIELVIADTNELQSVPDATNAIERVITREKVDVVMGGARTEAVLAMQEVAMDYKKLFLGVGAADAKLGENVEKNYDRYKYWFRVSPTKSPDLFRTLMAQLGAIAEQVRKGLGKERPKVALLAEKVVWNEGIIKGAQAFLPKMNMDIVGLWQPSAVATDVTAELAAIERAEADIIFTMVSGPMGIALGRQMGERNMKAIAWGINVEAQKDEFWQAAAGKANYVATLDTYAEVEMTPKTVPFVRAYKERFKKSPIYTAATYDAIHVYKAAVEQAGSTDPDKLVPVLEKMEHVGTGAVASWDKRHDLIWAVGKTAGIGVQWQDGKKVAFWPPSVKGMQPLKLPAIK